MNKADAVNDLEKDIIETEDKFDLTGLLLDFVTHWKWILLSLLIFGAGAYYYALTIVPSYQVDAAIYINSETADATNKTMIELSTAMNRDIEATKNTEIQILMSQNNLMKIVDSLELAYSYYNEGRLRDIPVYHNSAVIARMDSINLANLNKEVTINITRGDKGYNIEGIIMHGDDEEIKTLKDTKLPAKLPMSVGNITLSTSPFTDKMDSKEIIKIRNPRTIAARLSNTIAFRPVPEAPSVLNIDMPTPCIEEGIDVLKALISFYNKQIIEDKNRSAMQMESFILDRLVMINGELRDVEDRLRRYREQHNIADLTAQTDMNLSVRTNNEAEIASVDAEIALLKDVESQISRKDNYEQLPNFSSDATVTKSIETYNQAVSTYQRSLESMGESHPSLQPMRDALIKQKAQVVGNLATARNALSKRRSSIAEIKNRSEGQLAAQPTVDKGLNEIFREQQVKVNIYTYLLQKREEIALQKTLATPTVQFINNPSGHGPVAPNRNMYILIGLGIGLIIPLVIIALRRVLFPKFDDKEDLERLTKVPILGEICKTEGTADGVVVGDGLSTPVAELFRLLRNNVDFTGSGSANSGNKSKVVLITSSISGEGKTFITYNLAATYALTHKKVIVVGLDIRRPVLARLAGLNNNTGVTSFLSGQTSDLAGLIQPSDVSPNLFILPAGPIPPNPNELLLSENMTKMIDQLRNDFDIIIIDSAPIGMVSDTFLIAPHTDIQLYVTRAGVSTKRSLSTLHDAVRNRRLQHPYLILNCVNVGSTAYIFRRYGHYGYYGYNTYGYAYGYGYGYGEKTKRKWWQRIFKKSKHHHHGHRSKKQ
ncbi:MAG: GumC family protein [Muribaculaceae bacterium]